MGRTGGILRTSVRLGVAGGAVALYHQYGLWKDADETIRNYDRLKTELLGFLASAPPVVIDVVNDIGNYGVKAVSPVTERVSQFKQDWLNYDYSWISNKDGLVKPIWNKGVAHATHFLAHSPQIVTNWGKNSIDWVSEYMNAVPQPPSVQHRATISSVEPSSAASTSASPLENKEIKQ